MYNIKTINEYINKRDIVNPNKPSPNHFLLKLQLRMKSYYKDMYKDRNFNKKNPWENFP